MCMREVEFINLLFKIHCGVASLIWCHFLNRCIMVWCFQVLSRSWFSIRDGDLLMDVRLFFGELFILRFYYNMEGKE